MQLKSEPTKRNKSLEDFQSTFRNPIRYEDNAPKITVKKHLSIKLKSKLNYICFEFKYFMDLSKYIYEKNVILFLKDNFSTLKWYFKESLNFV